jgi:hypothetical protein
MDSIKHMKLFNMGLLALFVPVALSLLFFAIFCIVHLVVGKNKWKVSPQCVNVMRYVRNTFYASFVCFGGLLLSIFMGTLFVYTDFYYIIISQIIIGILSLIFFFTCSYLVYKFWLQSSPLRENSSRISQSYFENDRMSGDNENFDEDEQNLLNSNSFDQSNSVNHGALHESINFKYFKNYGNFSQFDFISTNFIYSLFSSFS